MKKFFYKNWAKICAAVLCIVTFNIMVVSVTMMSFALSEGVYDDLTKEEMTDRAYDQICMDYSIWAISQYQNDFGMEELKDTNFRYGVIQTDSIEGLDLNDESIYEVCNFDKEVTEDELRIHSFDMGESTDYYVGRSLFDSFYIYNHTDVTTEIRYLIEKCYYVRDRRQFYCQANGKFYQSEPDNLSSYDAGDLIRPVEGDSEEHAYVWDATWNGDAIWDGDEQYQIQIAGQSWYLSDIPIVTQAKLAEQGSIVRDDYDDPGFEEYSMQDGYVIAQVAGEKDTKPYYVLSYAHEPLEDVDGFLNQNFFGKWDRWEMQDFYVQAFALIQTAFSIRFALVVIFAVSLIVCLASFAAALTGAGHHNSEDVKQGLWDQIPFDIFCFAAFWIVFLCGGALSVFLEHASSLLGMQFVIFFLLLGEIMLFFFSMSFAVRVKTGSLFKNTICFRVWRKFSSFVKDVLKKMAKAFPMIWKAWFVMGVLAFLELMGLTVTAYQPGAQVFLWFVEKVALYAFLTICLLQMKKLQQAGEELAAGKMDSHLDTSRMLWDFRQHGDNLNNIREGIRHAVEEQMKSERFKTELITNVSHDIKTPLTSIINYVDLLEKEDIDNPNVKEYLEVLSRQSARLKKLIEDLMEASKASTGNLTVELERCDAHVMLTQTVGEFEEKLRASQIELLIKGSEAPLIIQADPRHLWRIFENLMNNICKYAQPSTRAYVNIEQAGDRGRIIFRNISKYALNINSEELMERFVRGDSSRNTEGSGLGLSIANSLTDLMQGTFELVVDGDLFKVILTFPAVFEEKN